MEDHDTRANSMEDDTQEVWALMKTPNGWPEETAEKIMWSVINTLRGRLLPHSLGELTYNAIHECVLEVLRSEYMKEITVNEGTAHGVIQNSEVTRGAIP